MNALSALQLATLNRTWGENFQKKNPVHCLNNFFPPNLSSALFQIQLVLNEDDFNGHQIQIQGRQVRAQYKTILLFIKAEKVTEKNKSNYFKNCKLLNFAFEQLKKL